MIDKKVFIITVVVLSVVILLQAVIIVTPRFLMQEVTTPEAAILIAKAAIVRRYGEEEIREKEFDAVIFGTQTNYWNVATLPSHFDNQPYVLVRISDGKVIMRWKNYGFWGIVDSWFSR